MKSSLRCYMLSGEDNRDEYCGESYPRPSPHIHDHLCTVKLMVPKREVWRMRRSFWRACPFLPLPSPVDSEHVLRSRRFNCAQIAEKAITTAIILLRHKTDITKGEGKREERKRQTRGRERGELVMA